MHSPTGARRLVYTLGIVILSVLAGLLLILFGGITDRLIPLFAVGAFLAFTLSQAGMVVHWKRIGGAGSATSLLVNGIGAVATGVALLVVLAAKFVEGAWITILLIPAMLLLFERVKRHYTHVAQQTSCPRPLNISNLTPPVVIVPIKSWNILAENALRFALRLSPDVIVVHISTSEAEAFHLRLQWEQYVEQPLRDAGLTQPQLMLLSSPYRRLFTPLLDYINQLKIAFPSRQIAVIIPELVESKWYEYLLHNQRATGLKAALLLRGDQRVVVINVPWYLREASQSGNVPPPAQSAPSDTAGKI